MRLVLRGWTALDEVRKLRRKKLEAKRPELMREFLRTLYHGYIEDELEAEPHAVVVVLIGANGPEVCWAGAPTTPELRAALWALQDAIRENRPWPSPEDVEAMKIRQAEWEAARPWACEYKGCTNRFTTKRGLAVHQRRCIHAPALEKS